jgi:hypothetical protein
MIPLSALPRKALNRVRGTWQQVQFRVGVPTARLVRASRLGAVKARLRPREVIVLECRSGGDATGLFSEFAAVLGILDHYERWQPLYAGVRVEFGDGLYYEPSFGPNWWEYYFEPINIGSHSGAPARVVSPYYHDLCANRIEQTMPRERAARLVARYVVLKPRIRAIVDAYVREHWGDAMVLGVHYRGTDKSAEAPRVPFDEVEAVVRHAISRAGPRPGKLFVATDEQAFLDYMRDRFPAQLLYREMFRSTDGRAIDVVNADGNHQKGEDAVLDCLLLSRTHALIRTASNLSLCAALFNPHVPETLLNRER